MSDLGDLARRWWGVFCSRCLRGTRIRPARGLGRRIHLWPATQVLHAGVTVEALVPGPSLMEHVRSVDAMVRALGWYRSGDAWGPGRGQRPRYADDVAWLGLGLTALARERAMALPEDVHRALAFVRSCEHPDGGVRWHEDAASRHTCSTAPAAHLAMLVHAETGDPGALAFARRSMAWLDANLRRPDGLYGDHLNDGIDDTVWAYNQGEAAAASALLTPGEPRGFEAIVEWLADPDVLWAQPQVFVGIAMRNLIPLDRSGRLRAAALTHLERVAAEGMADDGFPRDDGAGRYGDDVAIDLAGLIQTAAACAGPADPSR